MKRTDDCRFMIIDPDRMLNEPAQKKRKTVSAVSASASNSDKDELARALLELRGISALPRGSSPLLAPSAFTAVPRMILPPLALFDSKEFVTISDDEDDSSSTTTASTICHSVNYAPKPKKQKSDDSFFFTPIRSLPPGRPLPPAPRFPCVARQQPMQQPILR